MSERFVFYKKHTALSTWKVPYNRWNTLFWIKIIIWSEDTRKWSNNSGRSRWPRCLGVGFAVADTGGFESRQGYGRLSFVSVVCCQVEVSATGWSLVQRSPTECASLSVIRCNNNPLHLEKHGKKKRKRGTNNLLSMKYLPLHKTYTYIHTYTRKYVRKRYPCVSHKDV